MSDRPQKITFGEMREMGVRGLLIYCADYRCSHSIAISGDAWPMMPGCPFRGGHILGAKYQVFGGR
jgi:hypothetical protein